MSLFCVSTLLFSSKIEKVPIDIQGEKSKKDAASSVKLVSTKRA